MKGTASGPVLIIRAAPAKLRRKRDDMLLRVRRLDDSAIMPTRGTRGSHGFDISSPEEYTNPAKGKVVVLTKLSFAVPGGTYARIASRSGTAAKDMIDVGAGVVDLDRRGEIGIVPFNHGDEDYKVAKGDKIAQVILEKIGVVPCGGES